MKTKEVYGVDSIDGYIRKILGEDEPIAMMWPIYTGTHSPLQVGANIYGVDAGNFSHTIDRGMTDFFTRIARETQFYLGIKSKDTAFLKMAEKPVSIKEEDWVVGNSPASNLVAVSCNLPAHRLVVIEEQDDRIEVRAPQKIFLDPIYKGYELNDLRDAFAKASKGDADSRTIEFIAGRLSVMFIEAEYLNPRIKGGGYMPSHYLDSVKDTLRLPQPNIIIARDLAMDPYYRIRELNLRSESEAQRLAESGLRAMFEQYRLYAAGKPVVFVFDVHDFMPGGLVYELKGHIKFDDGMLKEYFDGVKKIEPNELGPLYILRNGYHMTPPGPVFLARSKS